MLSYIYVLIINSKKYGKKSIIKIRYSYLNFIFSVV